MTSFLQHGVERDRFSGVPLNGDAWDNTHRETFWACPVCGSRRVHIMSTKDGIICHRTRDCGFAPFVGGVGRTAPAVRVIPPI